ncbi:MAG: cell division protein FtsL [Clostridia bacterium]|nr:cell division protein FtsL [Clostridia bacterium]MDD4798245.1 cell division protein FtsL [Clostridia bacterium]
MVASRAARLFNIEEAREAVRQQELYILEKKEGRAKALKKDKKIVIAAVIVCFLAAFGYIFSEAVISDLGHQVVTLKEEINTVQNQNDRLGLEINQLQNMARIEEYAKLNLAMIYPEQSNTTYMPIAVAELTNETTPPSANNEKSGLTVTVKDNLFVNGFLASVTDLFDRYFNKEALAAVK